MDWLTFKFCVFIWASYCVSKSRGQSLLNTEKKCVAGEMILPPDECNNCICFEGVIHCTHLMCSARNNTVTETECVTDADIPQPDDCNRCICKQGRIACSNLICIPDPQCRDGPYSEPDACNLCVCHKGVIICTNQKCNSVEKPITPRCAEGEPMFLSVECVSCKCIQGQVKCVETCNPKTNPETRFAEETTISTIPPLSVVPPPSVIPSSSVIPSPSFIPPTSDAACSRGEYIPKPDDCNSCICFDGKVHCTSLPCLRQGRSGPQCVVGQPVYKPDECNECYCFDGKLDCSDLICIRGSKCVAGEVIPKPDKCNVCKCFEGHIVCTDFQCFRPKNTTTTDNPITAVQPLQHCQEGEVIPPPSPPDDCNKCLCVNKSVFCTKESCTDIQVPDIKGRFKEQNEQKINLDVFDKQISVDPFINLIYKKYDKTPTKLIHTHAYNGFHQEIKVHSNHLPKDATTLFKALATSLDNPALGDIGDKIKISLSDSVHNNNEPKTYVLHGEQNNLPSIPLAKENVMSNHQSFDSSEMGLSHSLSSLITSGSRINETILVIPSSKSFANQDSESVLPVANQDETQWNSPSVPAPLMYNKIHKIPSYSSKSANLTVEEKYFPDNPPLTVSSVEQYKITHNPEFSHPGLNIMDPTSSTWNTLDLSNQAVQPLNPKPSNMNDAEIAFAPFSQEDKQFKLTPEFESKRDDFQRIPPYQFPEPVNKYVSSVNPSQTVQEQHPISFDNPGSQHNPPYSQFQSNPPMYYTNQYNHPKNGLNPDQKRDISILNEKDSPSYPPIFQPKPNLTTSSGNQYNSPQTGFKPDQKELISTSTLDNESSQNELPHSQFQPANYYPNKKFPPQKDNQPNPPNAMYNVNKFYPPQNGLIPNQEQHVSNLDTKISKPKQPFLKFENDPVIYNVNKFYPPQNGIQPNEEQHFFTLDTKASTPQRPFSKFEYDPAIYNVNKFYPPQNGLKPDQEHGNSALDVKGTKPKPPFSKTEYPTNYNINNFMPTQNGFIPDQDKHKPGFTNIHTTPITQFNPPQSQFEPNHHTDQHDSSESQPKLINDSPQLAFAPDQEKLISPSDNEGTAYNATHSQYETHSTITYVTQYKQPHVQLQTDQYKNGPYTTTTNITTYNSPEIKFEPDQGQNESDLILSKVNQYLSPKISEVNEYNPYDKYNYPNNPSPNRFKPNQNKNISYFSAYPTIFKGNQQSPAQSRFQFPQNQPQTEFFDNRGSSDGFQYISNSAEDPKRPKEHQYKPPESQNQIPQNQPDIGGFDIHGSSDGFQYISNSAEDPRKPKHHQNKPSQSQFNLPQNQPKKGVFDDRGSSDGFQYVSNSAEDPRKPKDHQHIPPQSQFDIPQNQHVTGVFDDHGSPDGFKYLSNSVGDPRMPKDHKFEPSQSQFNNSQNQPKKGVFDDRGSSDGFQYVSNSAEDPRKPKNHQHKPSQSQFNNPQNQLNKGVFDDRGSSDGFQYVSNSAEDPRKPKDHQHKPPQSQFNNPQNQPNKGVFNDRGSSDGFQYVSNSAEDPRKPKDHKFEPPQSQYNIPQNLQYISNSAEDPRKPKDHLHKPPQSQFNNPQNQPNKGVFDDRGSSDGFQYVSNSAEDPRKPKDHKFEPPQSQYNIPQNLQYISNSAEDPRKPKDHQYKPQSQFKNPQNQPKTGVFDDHGLPDGFKYLSNSARDPRMPKGHKFDPPQSQFNIPQNQPKKGVFDDRGSSDGFQYVSNSAEDPRMPKDHQYKPPQSQFNLPQNQPKTGVFDERGSPDGFKYLSNSAGDPRMPKGHKFEPSQSLFNNPQNQPKKGVFDDRGSSDGFQYVSNSAEDPRKPKDHQHKPPQSQFNLPQNQPKTGVFDDHGSPDGFKYLSNSAGDPRIPKDHQFEPSQSQFNNPQNQPKKGVFDDRGSSDGFQYLSNSAEDPRMPKDHQYKPPQSQFNLPQNQPKTGVFDDHGSPDGFKYLSNSAGDPRIPKDHQFEPAQSQFNNSQNQPKKGVFDDRGSSDGFQYVSNSAEDPRVLKDHQYKPSQSQFNLPQNRSKTGDFDDHASPDGFKYLSNAAGDPRMPKDHQFEPPQSQFNLPQNQPIKGVFDDRGSSDGFQYVSNSAEDPIMPKDHQYESPQSQLNIPQKQPATGVFDDRGSSDGFQYVSNSSEDPNMPKDHQYKPRETQLELQPWSVNDREDPNGFQLKSSVEESTILNNNQIKLPQSRLRPKENQPELILVPHKHEYNTPLRPRIEPDHDQYKPSSIDTLLNGVHNIPWFLPDKKSSEADTSTPRTRFKPEQDQYKPSSIDNLLNGYHQITWSFPKEDKNALNSDAAPSNPQPLHKTDLDQYKPSSIENLMKEFYNISLPKPNQNQNKSTPDKDKASPAFDLINFDTKQYSPLQPQLNPELGKDNLFSLGDANYKNDLYPLLLLAAKKLSESRPTDNPDYAVGALDKELDLLPLLFPSISKSITIKPSPDQEQYTSSVESHEINKEYPLIISGNNINTLPDDDKGILSWLMSNHNNLKPSKYNVSVTTKQPYDKLAKEDIDDFTAKISELFSKLPPPQIKPVPELHNNFKPRIEDVKSKRIPTTTQYPSTESTSNYDNLPQYIYAPKTPEESQYQSPPVRYPDIHIILHQRNVEEDGIYSPYIENDAANQFNDVSEEQLDVSYLHKLMHSRFRYRAKDQKEECGEGTEWTSNCHDCFCQGGLAVCDKLPDCVLKSLGEPMICKPYSRFKMGECYACECNGDGIAECNATNCKTEQSSEEEVRGLSDSNELHLPVFKDFYDDKKTVELLRYYNFYKKLPKDCPSTSLSKYPTCEASTTWISSCHHCECNENGQHECTKMEDCEVDKDSYGKPSRCKPNTKFYPKTTNMPCIECTCNDEGNPYCPTVDYKKH